MVVSQKVSLTVGFLFLREEGFCLQRQVEIVAGITSTVSYCSPHKWVN